MVVLCGLLSALPLQLAVPDTVVAIDRQFELERKERPRRLAATPFGAAVTPTLRAVWRTAA